MSFQILQSLIHFFKVTKIEKINLEEMMPSNTDYGHMMSRIQIISSQNHNPIHTRYSFRIFKKVINAKQSLCWKCYQKYPTICGFSQNIWYMLEKSPYWASVVRVFIQVKDWYKIISSFHCAALISGMSEGLKIWGVSSSTGE